MMHLYRTIVQYKGDHALECLTEDSKHTYPAVKVRLACKLLV